MFTNFMRCGMKSKEKQLEFDTYYNTGLRNRVKLQMIDVERANMPQTRSYSNNTPYQENEKYRKEVEQLKYHGQPVGEDGFAQAPSDSSSTEHESQDEKVETMVDLDIQPKPETQPAAMTQTNLKQSDSKTPNTLQLRGSVKPQNRFNADGKRTDQNFYQSPITSKEQVEDENVTRYELEEEMKAFEKAWQSNQKVEESTPLDVKE